ncbi:MAG: hypothetical protein OSB41_00215 [Kiritimatiellae bacterium]|nr:hypothetical protein [Kiritimatiellia bacterium]
MTLRDSINVTLSSIRTEQLIASVLFFPSFGMLTYFRYTEIASVRIPAMLLLVALLLIAHAFWRVTHDLRCPACKGSLGHVMLNPNLTGSNYAVLLCPVAFPHRVETCPRCDAPMDENTTFPVNPSTESPQKQP